MIGTTLFMVHGKKMMMVHIIDINMVIRLAQTCQLPLRITTQL